VYAYGVLAEKLPNTRCVYRFWSDLKLLGAKALRAIADLERQERGKRDESTHILCIAINHAA
jgi:hypothetical protein